MAFIKKVLKIKENKNNKNERFWLFMSEEGSFFYAKFKNNQKRGKIIVHLQQKNHKTIL